MSYNQKGFNIEMRNQGKNDACTLHLKTPEEIVYKEEIPEAYEKKIGVLEESGLDFFEGYEAYLKSFFYELRQEIGGENKQAVKHRFNITKGYIKDIINLSMDQEFESKIFNDQEDLNNTMRELGSLHYKLCGEPQSTENTKYSLVKAKALISKVFDEADFDWKKGVINYLDEFGKPIDIKDLKEESIEADEVLYYNREEIFGPPAFN